MTGTARGVAAAVLLRVWEDEAFAAAALSNALDESGLDARDRGLCTELVYGVLRTEAYLTRRVLTLGKPPADDLPVLAQLLLGVYQLEFLDRVPARAAVHEAVEAVQNLRGPRVGGFVNAVLRRLSERSDRITLEEAIVTSTPSWLRKRLERSIGEEAARLLLSDVRQAVPCLRLAAGHEPPVFFREQTEPVALCPRAYRYVGGGDPRNYEEFRQGAFVLQELGAQLIARGLGVEPGDNVLDVCAGRGQKTAILAEMAGPGGHVVATDLHQHKLGALTRELGTLGRTVETSVFDWTQPPPESWHGAFDKVLVDAPCSGVGTLRRRPEITRRLTAEDPERLRELQIRILKNASRALKPGGTLLYATCSVLQAEGEEVTLAAGPELEARAFGPSELEPAFPREASCIRLLPHELGTDGYFVARLARHGAPG